MIHLKKNLFFLIIFLVSFEPLFSETNAKKMRYFHFFLKDQTHVHCLIFSLNDFELIIEQEKEGLLETVETKAIKRGAIAAINGGFFKTIDAYKALPNGILKIDNEWISYPQSARGALGFSKEDKKPLMDQLSIEFQTENDPCILPQQTEKQDKFLTWNNKTNILGGTPLLVWKKKALNNFSSEKTIKSFLTKKHARTAIGLLPDNYALFVVVDGTKNFIFSNSGITIANLALLMERLGCLYALNLDGGGSSTLIFEGEIMNTPCGEWVDDKGFSVRKVLNALLVIPKDEAL